MWTSKSTPEERKAFIYSWGDGERSRYMVKMTNLPRSGGSIRFSKNSIIVIQYGNNNTCLSFHTESCIRKEVENPKAKCQT